MFEFDDKDLMSSQPTRLLKNDIAEWKYGIKWINGYQFTIGRIYCIDIRDSNNEVIKTRLKSIYGIRKKELSEKYSKIVNVLYDNFFYDISGSYLDKFAAEKDLISRVCDSPGLEFF